MYLRVPLKPPHNRPLRVLIYARYSTEEQDASSVPDQFAYFRKFLSSQGLADCEVTELSDAEISGEIVSRPGIDEVWRGIRERRWDLMGGEDAGRFYRAIAPCLQLVGEAVDLGIRAIFINDDVDTAEEYWQDRLTEALSHHARSTRFTSQRIKRKHEALWYMGAAIGLLKAGYFRKPTVPARLGQRAMGPFFDEIQTEWQPVIAEVYQRISNGEPPWSVGEWLTTTGLPKCGNARTTAWSAKNVIKLIRRPDYRGEQRYRDTINVKHHKSGKKKPVRNTDEDGPLTRSMPHLRMVSDWLWHSANAAINGRVAVSANPKRGLDHPLAGIPRDSHGPLAQNFKCTICGRKMHQTGRGEGAYRCSGIRSLDNPCWNKATALRKLTHQALGRAISEQLIGSQDQLAVLVGQAAHTLQSTDSVTQLLAKARAEERKILAAFDSLSRMVERLTDTGGDAVDRLESNLRTRGDELHQVRLEIGRLESLLVDNQQVLLSPEDIAKAIAQVSENLLTMDREAGVLLKQLAPRILAVPYQQFQSGKVVLRAKFDLQLAQLLPAQLRELLRNDGAVGDVGVLTVPMCVDLFDRSNSPKFGLQAYKLKQQGLILVDIGERLGISKRSAHLAAQYGEAMTQAGLTDPFIELTQAPATASRWRTKRRPRRAG